MIDDLTQEIAQLRKESKERIKASLLDEKKTLIRLRETYKKISQYPNMKKSSEEGLVMIESDLKEIELDLLKLF